MGKTQSKAKNTHLSDTNGVTKPDIVVAVDIGTHGSGFAYQYRKDFEKNRSGIHAYKWRPSPDYKTPTSILLKPDGTFDSFGAEARKKFYRFTTRDIEDKPRDWKKYLFFERFKMDLYFRADDQIDDDMQMEAENQKHIPAIMVYTAIIKHMKDTFLGHLQMNGTFTGQLPTEDAATPDHIMWVITVPSIWSEPAKQLMYRAAIKAGISSDRLELALEPECAAIYCCNLPPENLRLYGDKGQVDDIIKPNAVLMIADIGGGTVDISVMMINEDKSMKQVYKSGGNPRGGERINNKILQELQNLFGEEVLREFSQTYGEDEKELRGEIESSKREWLGKGQYSIKFPHTLGKIWKQQNVEQKLEDHLREHGIKKEGGRLLLNTDIFENLYTECSDSIYDHLKKLESDELFTSDSVDAVLVVGGFATSDYLVEKLRDRLHDRNIPVIRPEDPECSVLSGAALYGHDEGMVSSRIMTKTYGVAMTTTFIHGRHSKEEMYTINKGEVMANNVFRKHIEVGQTVCARQWIQGKTYYPHSDKDKKTRIYIFQSDKRNPEHTSEKDCTYIGHVDVEFPDGNEDKQRKVIVDFYFAGTLIKVRATTAKQTIALPISRDV